MKNASIPNYKLPREYWLHNKALKISDVKRKKSSDDVGKGQLISKCPCEIIVSSKIPTKLFLDFCPEIFCSFLGAISWQESRNNFFGILDETLIS